MTLLPHCMEGISARSIWSILLITLLFLSKNVISARSILSSEGKCGWHASLRTGLSVLSALIKWCMSLKWFLPQVVAWFCLAVKRSSLILLLFEIFFSLCYLVGAGLVLLRFLYMTSYKMKKKKMLIASGIEVSI